MIPAKGVRIGFISCVVGDPAAGLHVTLARRYDATDIELVEMQIAVDRLIQPRLPLTVEWGNFCWMGEDGTIPAYRVHINDPIVVDLYRTYYKEAPNKALWPQPEYHVTVDTPAKRTALETLIRSSGRTYPIRDVSFKTRVEGGAQEVDAEKGTWTCAVCGMGNSTAIKTCARQGCDQWRPMSSAFAVTARQGDWLCCGVHNFASRTECMKCGRSKLQQQQQPSSMPEYDAPPTAPAKVLVVERSSSSSNGGGRRPDWHCVRCNYTIFGSKPSCGKCGTRNPAL
jgi:hypothetical protein